MPISSLFRQTQVSTAKPPAIKITLTAKDLLAEWHDSTYANFGSQMLATNRIRHDAGFWLESGKNIPYDDFIYSKYDSIIKLVDDNAVQSGQRENRPCYNRNLRLHKLECGHYIYTQADERPCGSNCEQGDDDAQAFFCILCFRVDQRPFSADLHRQHWCLALLPVFANPSAEQQACLRSSSYQHVEPAYLDREGYILLPRIHCVISLVLLWEARKEESLKGNIRDALSYRKAPELQIESTVEFLELLLAFHYELGQVDMHIMAALALCLHFRRQGRPCSPEAILKRFDRTVCPKVNEYIQLALDRMDTWAVKTAMQEMRAGLSRESRMLLSVNKKDELSTALLFWHKYAADPPTKYIMWPERQRYAAWFLARAFPDSCDIDETYQVLLDIVGVKPHAMFDAMIKGVMEKAVDGVNK